MISAVYFLLTRQKMSLKPILTIYVIGLALFASAQKESNQELVRVFDEKTEKGITIFGENNDLLPYTVEIAIQQSNLQSDIQFPTKLVIPANSGIVEIAKLTAVKKNKGWSYGSSFTLYRGDYNASHDNSVAYTLPFQKGEKYLMSQGYNGSFSHTGKNAIDFTMPEGTKVVAAREGIVIEVKEDSNRGCPNMSCMEMANKITIFHADGTLADYVHLQKKGSLVSVGEKVKRGQVIGLSGDTGFSSGPHLHFEVYLPQKNQNISIQTDWLISEHKRGRLIEKEFYTAF